MIANCGPGKVARAAARWQAARWLAGVCALNATANAPLGTKNSGTVVRILSRVLDGSMVNGLAGDSLSVMSSLF